MSTSSNGHTTLTPKRYRQLERIGTKSRDTSGSSTRIRTRIDSWRGSLRSQSVSSKSPIKSTATTAVTSTGAVQVAGVSYVVAHPELSLPDRLRNTFCLDRPSDPKPDPSQLDVVQGELAELLPQNFIDSAIEPAISPSKEVPSPTSSAPASESIRIQSKGFPSSHQDVHIHTSPVRARRRRDSSISRSSRSSSCPPSSLPSFPPPYSTPLADAPPAFIHTPGSDMDSSKPTSLSVLAPPSNPLDIIDSVGPLPPAAVSTMITPPASLDPEPSTANQSPQQTLQREERQGQTTWWDYVSWNSTKVNHPGSGIGDPEVRKTRSGEVAISTSKLQASNSSTPFQVPESTLTSPTSPPPPLIPFPLTETTTTVGLSLLNNIRTSDTPESTSTNTLAPTPIIQNQIQDHTISPLDKADNSNLNSNSTRQTDMDAHLASGSGKTEGGWYAYVPVSWSWGSASPGPSSPGRSGSHDPKKGREAEADVEHSKQDNSDATNQHEPKAQTEEVIVHLPQTSSAPSSNLNLDANPLTTSFQTNTLTWASFLRSTRRMLGVKRITGPDEVGSGVMGDGGVKRDENGVEVMEVDFDEGEGEGVLPALPVLDGGEGDAKGSKEKPDSTKNVSGAAVASSSSAAGLASRIWRSSTPTMSTTTANPSSIPFPTPSRTPLDPQTSQLPSRASTPLKRHDSPAPSISSKTKLPNMVVPKWEEIFCTPPRSVAQGSKMSEEEDEGERTVLDRGATGEEGIGGRFLGRTVRFVSGLLGGGKESDGQADGNEGVTREERIVGGIGQELPKVWKGVERDVLRGCKKVVVIGVHGWFPGAIVRTVLGEPTGTSTKFASMMGLALEEFEREYGLKFEKITLIPLDGEGTIEKRVDKLYTNLLSNPDWTRDLHESDVIFFAAHSQGSVVSTHLLDRLLREGHVVTRSNGLVVQRRAQRLCILSLCGIHLGPLRYLSSSTLVGPYLQYFESMAARELFEFQNTESQVSKSYVRALGNVLDHGTKIVYIASLNDQVVPMYSGLFTAVSHPLILRALYIDGDAYNSSDFLSNLLTLLIRILNSGLSDSGLLAHLSEATAGSLNGVGHSTVYEEIENYMLAVKYLFLTDDGSTPRSELKVEAFNALLEQNDYEIPWSLRDLIAHPSVSFLFSAEIESLREGFKAWQPKTTSLRELRRKVAPLGRVVVGSKL